MSTPVPASRKRRLMTASRLAALQRCARMEYYTYQLGYRARKAPLPLRFGTVWHWVLEAYWRGRQGGRASVEAMTLAIDALRHAADYAIPLVTDPALRAVLGRLRGVDDEMLDPYERARAEAMAIGYERGWRAAPLDVLGVEVEFQTPLLDPDSGEPSASWDLAGKMDVIARSQATQAIAVIEHKSTSAPMGPDTPWRDRLALDGQVDQYFLGSIAVGYPADYVLYDAARKPTLKPRRATECQYKLVPPAKLPAKRRKKSDPPPAPVEGPAYRKLVKGVEHDEEPDAFRDRILAMYESPRDKPKRGEEPRPDAPKKALEYFERVRLPRTDEHRREYAQDVWQYAWMADVMMRRAIAPKNVGSCFRYNTPCPFWLVCKGARSIDDGTIFRRADSVHEELGSLEEGNEGE